jgi:hypothetical protein
MYVSGFYCLSVPKCRQWKISGQLGVFRCGICGTCMYVCMHVCMYVSGFVVFVAESVVHVCYVRMHVCESCLVFFVAQSVARHTDASPRRYMVMCVRVCKYIHCVWENANIKADTPCPSIRLLAYEYPIYTHMHTHTHACAHAYMLRPDDT